MATFVSEQPGPTIRHRNVKIVATLGPSSSERETIVALAQAGVDVFRLNMSHGSHEAVRRTYGHIRSAEEQLGRPIAVLGDLQGPKLRCSTFADGSVDLVAGQDFRFDLLPDPGSAQRVGLPHPEIFHVLEPGSVILVNDGLVRLVVTACTPSHADCNVLIGGRVSDRKGVNVPSVTLPISALSDKDRADLAFLCDLGVDWVALSFVQRVEDVEEARALVGGRVRLISKIEKPNALSDFDGILEVSDGIMIARGDLGVELPLQKLPPIQKQLIGKCRAAGKPVIVATQMLESMIHTPVPTRAEVSDVATAIYDGADAIMLSAESAAGAYLVDAVRTMVSVAHEVESDAYYRKAIRSVQVAASADRRSPLTIAAREIAESGDVQAICCFTQSGMTALRQSRERPCVPILALTPVLETARRLCLFWGVVSRMIEPVERFGDAVGAAVASTRSLGLAGPDGVIAVTAGLPVHRSGATNILRLAAMDGSDLMQLE